LLAVGTYRGAYVLLRLSKESYLENLLEIRDVRKTFESTIAVNGISLDIPKKSIFGLLGPNGAGKTTLIRMITNIVAADSGTILMDGVDDPKGRMLLIGYMPEERGLYKKMKVGEQLLYLAQLKNLSKSKAKEKIEYWMEHFDIADWYGKRVEELSKGMQQKIQFISTIIHEPSLIILDEPFSGLDPVNSNLIRDEIYRLRELGSTVIFSTHRMEQVEQICDQIALIHKGNKILEGDVGSIKQKFKENKFSLEFGEGISDLSVSPYREIKRSERGVTVQLEDGQDSNELLRFFVDKGLHVTAFNELLPSINEIFIQQVGGQTDE